MKCRWKSSDRSRRGFEGLGRSKEICNVRAGSSIVLGDWSPIQELSHLFAVRLSTQATGCTLGRHHGNCTAGLRVCERMGPSQVKMRRSSLVCVSDDLEGNNNETGKCH